MSLVKGAGVKDTASFAGNGMGVSRQFVATLCGMALAGEDVTSVRLEFRRRPTYSELLAWCDLARASGLALTVSPSGGVVLHRRCGRTYTRPGYEGPHSQMEEDIQA